MKWWCLYLFFIIILPISSCAPVYLPTMHHSPQFTGSKEFQASINIVPYFDNHPGLNVQAALSITDHVGVAGNYLHVANSSKNKVRYKNHDVGEIAVGYYTNFNKRWCFEMYAGAGLGSGFAFDSNYSEIL